MHLNNISERMNLDVENKGKSNTFIISKNNKTVTFIVGEKKHMLIECY